MRPLGPLSSAQTSLVSCHVLVSSYSDSSYLIAIHPTFHGTSFVLPPTDQSGVNNFSWLITGHRCHDASPQFLHCGAAE